jgi:hypothetical protein
LSKSNPHDSQNRPDLSVPQFGQGTAGTGGCASCAGTAAGAAALLAEPPIFIPQTSQKSPLAES